MEPTLGRSESVKELTTALAKAQAEITGAEKKSENPHFKSNYADLASVWEACREPLSKNGLSVTQTTYTECAQIHLVTTLFHSSGEWLASKIPLILQRQDMQGLGSALTYARRYSLAAIVGVAQEDDDGNAAGKEDGKQKGKNVQTTKERPSAGPRITEKVWVAGKAEGEIIATVRQRNGWQNQDVAKFMQETFKKERLSTLTKPEYETLLATVGKPFALTKDQPRIEADGVFATTEPELKQ